MNDEEPLENAFITDVHFAKENTLSFVVFKRKFDRVKNQYYEEEKVKFEHNIETNNSSYSIIPIGTRQKDIENGMPCRWPDDCRSGFCSPGPLKWNYCLHDRFHCVKPNADGKVGEEYLYSGQRYICEAPGQLIKLP